MHTFLPTSNIHILDHHHMNALAFETKRGQQVTDGRNLTTTLTKRVRWLITAFHNDGVLIHTCPAEEETRLYVHIYLPMFEIQPRPPEHCSGQTADKPARRNLALIRSPRASSHRALRPRPRTHAFLTRLLGALSPADGDHSGNNSTAATAGGEEAGAAAAAAAGRRFWRTEYGPNEFASVRRASERVTLNLRCVTYVTAGRVVCVFPFVPAFVLGGVIRLACGGDLTNGHI